MNSTEKEISYLSTNSYSTLNTLTTKTKTVWFVCHGMGYLSRYFINYFKGLNADENYIIAPQAQSKYYIAPKYKHVGGSWLSKENTIKETENIMRYFDAVLEAEQFSMDIDLIVLGYSQGVSVAMRYVALRKLNCNQLVLMSGGIPNELIASDFDFLKGKTKISLIYGTEDEYMNEERMGNEKQRINELFGNNVGIIPFKGKHEINKDLLNKLCSI